MSKQFYSQCGQDAYLYQTFFNNKTDGFFVEIGAYDGVSLSNSLFFEEQGWRGMLIEPHPKYFPKILENRPNPNTIKVNVAVGDKDEFTKFLSVSCPTEHTGMLSGIDKAYDLRHKARIQREVQMYGGQVDEAIVQVRKTQNLFDEHDITHIDYLSLDVEGSEKQVLSGIDFNKTFIHVLTVEDNYNDGHIFVDMLKPYFVYKGNIGHDLLFVNNKAT